MDTPTPPQDATICGLLVAGHHNADFDSLASSVLGRLLHSPRFQRPSAAHAARGPPPPPLPMAIVYPGSIDPLVNEWVARNEAFLKDHDFITSLKCPIGERALELANDGRLTLVIVDGRRRSRFAHVSPLLDIPGSEVHVYDHHPPSEEDIPALPDNCVVKPLGSCTALLLHEIVRKIKESNGAIRPPYLTREEATLCGLGIYSDTGSFGFSSTTKEDFEAAALLLTPEFGPMNLSDILDHQHKITNIANTATTSGDNEGNGLVLKQLECNAQTYMIRDERVVITHIITPVYINNFSSIVQRFMDQENIHGAVFGLGMMEDRGRVVLVGRSRSPSGKSKVDVGRICSSLGGGGHRNAASATIIDLTLEEVKNRLYALVVSQVEQNGLLGDANDIVTRSPIVAYSKQPIAEVHKLFSRFDLKKMPVLEGEPPPRQPDVPFSNLIRPFTKVVGIIDRSVSEKAVGHNLADVAVEEYMDMDFETLTTNDTLYQAVDIIMSKGQRLIPILSSASYEAHPPEPSAVNAHDDPEKLATNASSASTTLVGVVSKADLVNMILHQPSRFPTPLLARHQEANTGSDGAEEKDKQTTQGKASNRPTISSGSNVRDMLKGSLNPVIFSLLQKAGSIAHSTHMRVYVVGGFVRDLFMHVPNHDIDLVVEGDGMAFATKLAKATGGDVGHRHKFSTALVKLPDGFIVDVATARLEYYPSPAALPCVELSSLKMDLYRRDFTINAMAIELTKEKFGNLVDYFGGLKDLKQKIIRVQHSLSFVEDPTRILRAIRFEQRYGFTIEKQSIRALRSAIEKGFFNKLTGSRMWKEFHHMLCEDGACVLSCLQRARQLHIPENIFQPWRTLFPNDKDLRALQDVLDWYQLSHLEPRPEQWKAYLLVLTAHIRKFTDMKALMDRFLFSDGMQASFIDLRESVRTAHVALEKWTQGNYSAAECSQEGDSRQQLSDLYSILHSVPLEGLLYMMSEKHKDQEERRHIVVYLTHLRYVKLDIDGKDLIKMGLPPGPHFKVILESIMRAKLNGNVHTKDDEIQMAKSLIEEEIKKLDKSCSAVDGNDLLQLGLSPGPLYISIFRQLRQAVAQGSVSRDKSEQLQYVRSVLLPALPNQP